jgi:hypothetical protein
MYGADKVYHSPEDEKRCARQFFLLEALKLTDEPGRAIEIAERMRQYVEDGRDPDRVEKASD